MSNLIPSNQGLSPRRVRSVGRELTTIDAQTDIAIARVDSTSDVEAVKVDAVGSVGKRREWDSNPRRVAPHTLSKRADSAALASLPGDEMLVARSQHVSGDPAALGRFR